MSKFGECYQPSSCYSIDESMVRFKGKKSFKQYMPLKPIKRGFKVWVRADASTGFVIQFDVYTGKESDGSGLGTRVVKKFTEEVAQTECLVVFDNFFSSPELLQNLFEEGIYSVATVRQQRKGLPEILKNKKKMKEGDHTFRVKGNVAALQWQDKRLVNILTTAHNPSHTVNVSKKAKDGTKIDLQCPLAIVEYTKYMRGVDRFDQLREYYTVSRKSRKWWMRLFYFILDCALVNSYVLYRLSNVGCDDHVHFLIRLSRQLVNGYTSRKRSAALAPR
ncbi:piggyBac transposable element-derived protein 4-like [Dermacentor andersoni]|uniref:piggyBac transposable element-derived protein 4-like n=1 Tax=Dermacentor andersoni TaxID=34620 RepID=UPI002417935C|nr:piggyBac transposable element-derived protein 4-like [Dermacentor andersoni]